MFSIHVVIIPSPPPPTTHHHMVQRHPGTNKKGECAWSPHMTTLRNPLTFMHARVLVLQHSQFIDPAELLKERPQVLLVQVPRDLADEELDRVLLFRRRRRPTVAADRVAAHQHRELVMIMGHPVLQSSHVGLTGHARSLLHRIAPTHTRDTPNDR